MTRQEANVYLAVILDTVASSPHGAPSGHLYAALMSRISLDTYNALLGVCVDSGLVKVAWSHLVTITEKGKGVVKQIQALTPTAATV